MADRVTIQLLKKLAAVSIFPGGFSKGYKARLFKKAKFMVEMLEADQGHQADRVHRERAPLELHRN